MIGEASVTNDYDRYDEWKGWGEDQFMVLGERDRIYFDAEFADIPVRGQKVLEVGFGSGSLLAWLRDQGAELYGTELSSQGRALAARHGVIVLDIGLSHLNGLEGRFGVVAALDVLEHLTHQEIGGLLDKAAALLRPGGYFVARFPNGSSPLGRVYQHGDITHITTLTELKLRQLILGKPFEIRRAAGGAEIRVGGFALRLAKRGRSLLRKGFEPYPDCTKWTCRSPPTSRSCCAGSTDSVEGAGALHR